ncbi:hypothetical protein A2V56_03090 [Candidatus Woesebacteria bacterium RBG_19FT_COMBO_42_9]|uniref:Uncharacterized protein n=1 Tax=Candidatus Woesebacteria bacterium RBG_16_42_24 TaxID=1802485 RepID=A0A1F7XK10_9BACT|nr:MAG: hypothetical protein A2V97_02015 [Candidatus Woesebacteria bacterium RBG_16_42_24]OGM16364.1 MAG: hypothetical protein A2V56_03090 [Candidatus Woesebacteria bacterium RBG_19FT_COMBO_42_9]OGM67413.1 MAG: hypothetical protein A2985_04710 [Candidatus Woesebacteria bacterium RIFCSPLOWO2_01_FULL_43_11]
MGKRETGGFSVIEILVVVLVFVTLAVLATESLLLSLRGSKRSESSIGVRENLNYALSIMERQLHNAESITLCTPTEITYTDTNALTAKFSCDLTNGFVASSSAQLTSSEVRITACNFTCTTGSAGIPASVSISLTAEDADSGGLEQQQVTTNTQIMLRTY